MSVGQLATASFAADATDAFRFTDTQYPGHKNGAGMANSTKNNGAIFRFLKPKEYAALTAAEKARYLQQALEAIKSGAPLDDLPLRELPPMEDEPGGGGGPRRTKATR